MCIVAVTRYACGCDWHQKSQQSKPGRCSQLAINRVCDNPVKINKYDERLCGKAAGFRQLQRTSCMGDSIRNVRKTVERAKCNPELKRLARKEKLLREKLAMLKNINTYLWFESSPTIPYKPQWTQQISSPTAPVHSTPGATNVLHQSIITGVNTGTLAHFNAVNSSAVHHGPASLPIGYMPNAATTQGGFGGAQQGTVATMELLQPQPQVLASEQQGFQPLHVNYADAQQGATATMQHFGPQSQVLASQQQEFQPVYVSYADAQHETAFPSPLSFSFPPGLDDVQDTNCVMEVGPQSGFGFYELDDFTHSFYPVTM